MGRGGGRALVLGVTAALTACGAGERPAASVGTFTVTDSAGVEIVHSTAPVRGELTLGRDPLLEIRSDPGDPATLLYRVVGVEVLPDGRVALANLGDNTLRLHSPEGRLLWRAGGGGEGPGEFVQLRGMVRLGDELVGYQPLPRPAQLFDLEGRWLRSLPTPQGQGPRVRGILAGGTVVADLPVEPRTMTAGLHRVALVQAGVEGVDTLAILPSLRSVDIPALGFAEAQALGPYLQVAVGDTLSMPRFRRAGTSACGVPVDSSGESGGCGSR